MRTSDQPRQAPSEPVKESKPLQPGPLGRRINLIRKRERMGFTMRGFARTVGVSHETVRRFENGHLLLPHQALKVAAALGVDYDEIVPPGSRELVEQRRQFLKAAA